MKTKFLFALVFFATGFTSFSQITLTLQPGPLDGKDAHLKEIEANVNFGNHPDFIAYIWTFNQIQSEGRTLMKFDLSMLPLNAIIMDAKLSLYHNPISSSAGHYGINESHLKVVTGFWHEDSVTWATMPPTTTNNAVYLATSSTTTQNYLNIDITSHVAAWHASPITNHGFMIENILKTTYRSMKFCSSDHPNTNLRPKLVIVYDTLSVPPIGPCPSYSFLKANICQGDSIWLQSDYQQNSGVYFDTLTSFLNQDSIVVTALYVYPPFSTVSSVQICKGDSLNIGGIWQKPPGIYPQTWFSVHGCDSTNYVQLSYVVIDSTVTLSGTTLTANQSGATYQWVDCEPNYVIIPGAIGQSFTPVANGSYAVIIIKDGCTVISPCMYVGGIAVPSLGDFKEMSIHPNPTLGHLTVDFGKPYAEVSMLLLNTAGQAVYYHQATQVDRLSVNISHLSHGNYTMLMNIDGVQVSSRIIKL
jgi:hypothetical protein